jgi:hypothetical protein
LAKTAYFSEIVHKMHSPGVEQLILKSTKILFLDIVWAFLPANVLHIIL